MRKDNRFRFTLQWAADTQERVAAGEFLEKLGNKKSDIIVLALWEYLQRHPDTAAPEARIKITTQPIFNKEQILMELKGVVKSYVEEVLPSMSFTHGITGSEDGSMGINDDDLDTMLENLDVFDQ